MSKNLNVNSGNYTIRVTDGNTITLDTGPTGTTTLTGNLTVAGTTTTVNSTDLSLKDNIIKINDGETGSGITLNTAGIQFDRGTQQDALFLFDEQTSHNDPVTQNNPRMVEMLKRIPSAEELIIEGPGHFIQEEAGPEYANLIINFINGDPKPFKKKRVTTDIEL